MNSITLAQAALFAAWAMAVLTGFYLFDNAVLLKNAAALVLLGSAVPSAVWTGFFFAVSRSSALSRIAAPRIAAPRIAAWITLVFGVLLEALVVYIRFQRSVSYWTPFGSALSPLGWLLRLGWAVFLISFALDPEHAPDNSRTRRIALVLAILSAPSALSTAYDAWNNWIGLLVDDLPRQALWRVLITPAVRTIYWLSQILFLWRVWGNPETRDPIETSSSRLEP